MHVHSLHKSDCRFHHVRHCDVQGATVSVEDVAPRAARWAAHSKKRTRMHTISTVHYWVNTVFNIAFNALNTRVCIYSYITRVNALTTYIFLLEFLAFGTLLCALLFLLIIVSCLHFLFFLSFLSIYFLGWLLSSGDYSLRLHCHDICTDFFVVLVCERTARAGICAIAFVYIFRPWTESVCLFVYTRTSPPVFVITIWNFDHYSI